MIKKTVIYSDDVESFLSTLSDKARRKIIYNITLVANGVCDKELFKKLEGTDLWELRTLYQGIAYRILAFWDTEKDALIVTTHGFIKKTDKTPKKEIEKGIKIMKEYFSLKNISN